MRNKSIENTKKVIFFAFIVMMFAVPLAYSESVKNDYGKMYFVDFEYDKGNLKLHGWDILSGYYPEKNSDGSYRIQLFSGENNLIYTDYFEPPTEVIFLTETGTYITDLDSVNFTVAVPYYENAKRMEISDDSKVLIDISLPEFKNRENKNKIVLDANWNRLELIIRIGLIVISVLTGFFFWWIRKRIRKAREI